MRVPTPAMIEADKIFNFVAIMYFLDLKDKSPVKQLTANISAYLLKRYSP